MIFRKCLKWVCTQRCISRVSRSIFRGLGPISTSFLSRYRCTVIVAGCRTCNHMGHGVWTLPTIITPYLGRDRKRCIRPIVTCTLHRDDSYVNVPFVNLVYTHFTSDNAIFHFFSEMASCKVREIVDERAQTQGARLWAICVVSNVFVPALEGRRNWSDSTNLT